MISHFSLHILLKKAQPSLHLTLMTKINVVNLARGNKNTEHKDDKLQWDNDW